MSIFTGEGNENQMRWDRAASGFMEVWYVTLIDPRTRLGIWIRYTLTAPIEGPPYCELWGFCFDPAGKHTFAGKRRFPIEMLGGRDEGEPGEVVRIGDAWLGESHLEGALLCGGRSFEWGLDLDPMDRCFQHVPAPLRSVVERRASTLCSPNLSVPFRGSVVIDGEPVDIDRALGCQTHRWGAGHSISWAWAHCSVFDDDDAVLEGVAAKTKVGPVPLPTSTLLYLQYQGRDIPFNDIGSWLRARGTYELPTWEFSARNSMWRMVGAARARPDRMVQVGYADPDGSNRYCANSGVGDLAVELDERSSGRWVHAASLRATGTCHVEFGGPAPFDEVPVSF